MDGDDGDLGGVGALRWKRQCRFYLLCRDDLVSTVHVYEMRDARWDMRRDEIRRYPVGEIIHRGRRRCMYLKCGTTSQQSVRKLVQQ